MSLYLCLSIYLCLSVFLSTCVFLSLCLSVYLPLCLPINLSVCLCVSQSVCLSIYLSVVCVQGLEMSSGSERVQVHGMHLVTKNNPALGFVIARIIASIRVDWPAYPCIDIVLLALVLAWLHIRSVGRSIGRPACELKFH